MDPGTSKKIVELAKNLKALHLAASTEEAEQRAKEIILGTVKHEELAEVEQGLAEVRESLHDSHDDAHQRLSELKEDERSVEKHMKGEAKESRDVLGRLREDEHTHALEKSDTKALERDVDTEKRIADDIKDIVELAEKVQKKKK